MRSAASRRRLVLGALLLGWLLAACGSSSPTEPPHARRVVVSTTITSTEGAASVLTVQADVCGCSNAALQLKLDAADLGTVGCGETRSFPITREVHQLVIYSPLLAAPLTAGFDLTGSGNVVVLVELRCES